MVLNPGKCHDMVFGDDDPSRKNIKEDSRKSFTFDLQCLRAPS